MGIINALKKFKDNFVGNVKYIAERLSYGMKKAEERRSKLSSDPEFQNFSNGIQNLNKNLLGDSDNTFNKYNTPQKFNDALTGTATPKSFDNDIPNLRIPKSGLEKKLYPKNKRYIIEEDEDEPDVIYIQRKKRQKRKSHVVYVEDDDDVEVPKGFKSSFENLSGVPDDVEDYDLFEEYEPKKPKRKKPNYDFLHGSE